MTLISILSKLLVEDKNIGLKMQAFEALKTLLDPNIAASSSGGSNGLSPTTMGGMGTLMGQGQGQIQIPYLIHPMSTPMPTQIPIPIQLTNQ